MKIILTAKFEREYKKLSNVLKDKAKAAIEIFSKIQRMHVCAFINSMGALVIIERL